MYRPRSPSTPRRAAPTPIRAATGDGLPPARAPGATTRISARQTTRARPPDSDDLVSSRMTASAMGCCQSDITLLARKARRTARRGKRAGATATSAAGAIQDRLAVPGLVVLAEAGAEVHGQRRRMIERAGVDPDPR